MDVAVVFYGEEQPWGVTFLVTESDAYRIRNLSAASKPVEIPSLRGFARIQDGELRLRYFERDAESTLGLPFADAKDVIDEAIVKAASRRVRTEARKSIWDWTTERIANVHELDTSEGSSLTGMLMRVELDYVAIRITANLAVMACVANDDEIPPINSRVLLDLDEEPTIHLA